MCGICGLAYASSSALAEAHVRTMAAAMRHRGPDEDGFFVNDSRAPGLALGMRRLSIIDLSAEASARLERDARHVAWSSTVNFTTTANCAQRLDHGRPPFSTQSDTEILVHGWEEWGEDLLQRTSRHVCVRAAGLAQTLRHGAGAVSGARPLGIKPLYYAQTPEGVRVCFGAASDAGRGAVPQEISVGCADVLSFVWQRVRTGDFGGGRFFASARAPVAAACAGSPADSACAAVVGSAAKLRRRGMRSEATRLCYGCRRLRTLLDDSVRAHLIADVPVGLFLSSGLDSSAIAALAARAQRGDSEFHAVVSGHAV